MSATQSEVTESRQSLVELVYQTVIENRAQPAEEIAKIAGITTDQARSALHTLRKAGKVLAYRDDTLRYNASRWIDARWVK